MTDTTLYRVQREDGAGPYDSGAMAVSYGLSKMIHPGPYNDGIHTVPLGYQFAFESPTMLLHWFGHRKIMHDLEGYGYLVAELRVPRNVVLFGYHQAVYDRNAVVSVVMYPFDKLIENMVH